MFTSILPLSLASTVLATIVGTFWYSPMTPMGKIHMQYLGFDKLSPDEQKKKMEEAKPKMAMMYAVQMLLSFMTSFAVVFILSMSVQNGLPFMMAVGFPVFIWLCFMVPVIGSALLWNNCDRAIVWQKFFSDSLSHLVIILLIAGMVSFFI